MKLRLAALLLAAAAPAPGAVTDSVRRGDVVIHVSGTVVPDDVFRLKSTIEGRIESVDAPIRAWRRADQPLAELASKELAAMIDARGTQHLDLLEDRWSRMYPATPARCPGACYVLKVYAKPRTWVKPQAVLFEAASGLKLIGRVRPEVAHLIRDGMTLTYWAVNDPKRKLTGKVGRYSLDMRGERVGAAFTIDLTPDRYLDPGTEWAGEIVPLTDVLLVPTASLISHDGSVYLPVRVSTGMTTADFTQITAGVEEKRPILVLDSSRLHGEARHGEAVDRAALELRRRELDAAAASGTDEPDGGAAPRARAAGRTPPAESQPTTIEEKDYGGEDPYGEQ